MTQSQKYILVSLLGDADHKPKTHINMKDKHGLSAAREFERLGIVTVNRHGSSLGWYRVELTNSI